MELGEFIGDTPAADECLHELLPCSGTLSGNIFLVLNYSFILAYGAKMISHGSETLMEILSPGIIGGFVLPVLGALPDAAIIFVSALGGDIDQVQAQLAIGMGTLAGSNVLLLTIPWAASLWIGKVDINEATGIAKSKTYTKFSWTKTGVSVFNDVSMIARLMIVTLLPYTAIQLSYIILRFQQVKLATAERWWALGSFIICCLLFVGYSVYQVLDVTMQQRRLDKAKEERMWNRFVRTLAGQVAGGGENAESWLLSYQMPHVFNGSTHNSQKYKANSIRAKNKSDLHSPQVDKKKLLDPKYYESEVETDEESEVPSHAESPTASQASFDDYVPKSAKRTGLRASAYLLGGTALVLLFADPMVKSIGALGNSINLSPFYISFVVTPVASNSSELFAAVAFAKKKTKKTTSLIHSALYGAVAMNNTISLGVFLAMIFFRQLKWDFSAETLVIAFVTLAVGLLASFKTTFRTYHIIWVLALYPISIAMVALLESPWVGWD